MLLADTTHLPSFIFQSTFFSPIIILVEFFESLVIAFKIQVILILILNGANNE